MGDLKIIIVVNIRKFFIFFVLFKKYLVFIKCKMIKIFNLRGNLKILFVIMVVEEFFGGNIL